MNELANIYRGKSFTIGFAIPETYDTDRIEDIKINIGTKIYAHTIVQGVVKVELTSEQTARMVGKQDVVFTIQDNTFGVRKLLCGYIYVSSTISKFESESYNDVYDVLVMLSYNEGIIDVDHVLFDYLRSKSPFEIAVEEGYTGTQEEFNQALADIANKVPYEDATRNLDLTGHTVISDSAKFNTSATPAFDPAEMGWESGEKVLSFGLEDGGRAQINKEIFDFYTNVDSVTLVEGDAVSISQVSGNRKAIKRTNPAIKADAENYVGIVTVASIAPNATGRVTKIGHVSPYNSSGLADNDRLFVSHINIGKLVTTPPPAGYYTIQAAYVVVAATNGTIDVRGRTIPKLVDLSDVDGVPWNTSGQIPVLQSDGTFSGTANIEDYYTASETDDLLDDKVDTSLVGAANGLATLGSDGLVPSTQLPSFVDDIIDAYGEYTDDSDPTTLVELYKDSGKTEVVDKATGKIYLDVVNRFQFRWSGSAWGDIKSGPVQSVNGKTGNVVLAKSDVGLGNVDNTSDANKPISTATQTALNGKVSTTGNETISGVKTYISSPQVPNPLTDNDAANRVFVVGVADSAMTKAQQWAENPEDVQVETGKYSSKHWATKALAAYLQLPNTERALADLLSHLLGRIDTLERLLVESKYNTMQVNSLSVVDNIQLKGADLFLLGTAAPAVTPDFIGQFFVNTTGGVIYQAKGITNSGDWKQTSN